MKSVVSILITCFISILLTAATNNKINPLIDVLHYEFNINVNDTNDIIKGKAVIRIKFNSTVSDFELDLKGVDESGKGMKVDSLTLSAGNLNWSHSNDRLHISLSKEAQAGSECEITVTYSGIPADGLIISRNKFGNRTFFADHWPDRARNYLPCVDNPADKATVDFIITTPVRYEVVASGYMVEESDIPGGTRLTHWKEDVPLATKVMTFGAASFAVQFAGKVDGIPVWTWVYPENRKEGFYDYSFALKPLAFYDSLIGPYSYEKLANVQSKTIFGGLENAGCIFYSENSVTGKGRAESLLAHEIAHQWFGNSVTEGEWHHIWLSEGFATYLTSVYMEKTYGKEKLNENMKSDRDRVLRSEVRSPGPVIDTTITDLMKLLSTNSYQKGAWVLHMLRQETGDEVFWKGIRLFYNRYRNKNAITGDFRKVMEEVSGKDLGNFFYQWLYVPGQPDLKITKEVSKINGSIEITIEQQQSHLFTFHIEIAIKDSKENRILNVFVKDKITRVTVQAGSGAEIIPDPGVKLLFRNLE